MVKIISILLFLIHAASTAAEIKIQAEADGKVYENTPIKVLVTITHSKNDKIDSSSFTADGKPITVELDNVKEMTATGDLVLTMFHFELPPKKKGLQAIPPVKVTISGKPYSSVPSTYEVLGSGASSTSVSASQGERQGTSFLKYEPIVEGPKTLYPGQKTILGYRYTFNTNVNATVEETPLLEATGLVKVGDKMVQQDENQGVSTIQVLQIVKGDKPGDYTYGPSKFEGTPYETNALGQIVQGSTPITSIAPPVTIKVIPFPAVDKPASFNGALGNFDWKVSLTSASKLSAGDELSLKIEAIGKGDWDSVNLPELCCQPGISGLFRLSDLPPTGKVEGGTKTFIVQMRPLSTSIKEVPSLEFSSLDPVTAKYQIVHSPTIPLTVEDPKIQVEEAKVIESKSSGHDSWQEQLKALPPLEISRPPTLLRTDLSNLHFGDWWVLFLIPFGIGLLIFQYNWINFLTKRREERLASIEKSSTLMDEAASAPSGSAKQHALIKEALLQRLVEVGELPSTDIDPHDLDTSGPQGEVSKFLLSIDEMRYAGQQYQSYNAILDQAKTIYAKMRGS